MIFKPSSLHKVFFTYICPRFYGGAPPVPSNTTTTSTVNQSPWQNPVYQALMLGTKDQPGPATSMLNASREQMEQWNAINKTGLTPAAQASLGTWNPDVPGSTSSYINKLDPATGQYTPTANPNVAAPIEQSAAQGGIMSLRGYASGGAIDPVQQTVMDLVGRQLSDTDLADLKRYSTQLNTTPAALMQQYNGPEIAAWKAAPPEKKAAAYQKIVDAGGNISPAQNTMLSNFNTYKSQIKAGTIKLDASGNPTANIKQGATNAEKDAANAAFTKATDIEQTTGKAPYGLMDTMKKIANVDPKTLKSTDPAVLAVLDKAANLKTPEQFAAATDMYGKSAAGLEAAAKYKPTNVSAKKADVANAASKGYTAANANAAQLNRGSVRDIAAKQASVDKYKADMMAAPSDINAQEYQAALADLNQMEGPQSWIGQGTSEAYMSPYMQNVVDIQKRESNRDYAKQLQDLNKQATAAGAFGGSRQAIERSEAARNQATKLADIEAQGLQQAYQSGMGQFSAEQGLRLQAGQANLTAAQQTAQQNQTAVNQQRSQYVQQALDAAKNNYGGQLTAAQQNQVAQNAALQFNSSAQNLSNNNFVQQQMQAQQANQGMDFNVGQMNTTNQQQTNLSNQQAANQASQFGASAQNTANLANQQAANNANNAYVQNQLTAGQGNQQAGLTANQQGIGALQGMGQIASGLTSTGSAQNAADLATLGAQGQAANAGQNLAQSVLDAQSGNAATWFNAPTTIGSGVANLLNTQNVQGGTGTATTNTSGGSAFGARGGLIKNGKVSNRGKK